MLASITLLASPFVTLAAAAFLIHRTQRNDVELEDKAAADTQRRHVQNSRILTPREEASWTGIPAAA